MIARALCFWLVFAFAGSTVAADDRGGFRLGVRADARPFVFARADGSYSGFLYDMCRAALKFAGIDDAAIELVPVTAATRFKLLDDLNTAPDLLCDPTTITMERMARWDFTPIVFFATSTTLRRNRPVLLSSAQAPAGCDVGGAREVTLIGWVENTTSDTTVAEISGQAEPSRGNQAVCAVPFERYDEGIRDICSDDARLSFYVGDADILSAQVDEMRREGLPCWVTFEPRANRPEPYALIVGDRLPQIRRSITAGIYEFFRTGAAEKSFEANFPGRRKSGMLTLLFDLYQIPALP